MVAGSYKLAITSRKEMIKSQTEIHLLQVLEQPQDLTAAPSLRADLAALPSSSVHFAICSLAVRHRLLQMCLHRSQGHW